MPPKSGFSRTKNVDYEDDDMYDDDEYWEEQEGTGDMTTDDKERMRAGTIRVRDSLGETSAFVTDEQVHEALWYYYFDVEKSVSYLKNTLGTKSNQDTPKKEKPVSRFDHAAKTAELKTPSTKGKHIYPHSCHLVESTYLLPRYPAALSLCYPSPI